MVIAWSSHHHHRSDPCSWVPHRSHAEAIHVHSTPFAAWSSSSHGSSAVSTVTSSSSSSSSSSSHLCGLPTFASPPSPPPPLFLPPCLATFPPPGHPHPSRDRSHALPQELSSHLLLSGGNRISEEVVSNFTSSADAPPGQQVHQQSSPSPFCQGSSYSPEVAAPSRAAPPPPTVSSNTGEGGTPSPRGGQPPHYTHQSTKVGGRPSYATEGPAAAPSPRIEGTAAPPAGTEGEELGALWQLLDDDLKPAMPQPSCPQSQQIFQEHKGLAHQLLVVQEEIVYLDREKKQLLMKLEEQDREQQACRQRYADKIIQLKSKNESLRHDHSRLSQQLEEIRSRRLREQQTTEASPDHQQQHLHHQPSPQSSHMTPSPYFSPQYMQEGQPSLHQQQHSSTQRQPQNLPLSQHYYDSHHHHHHLYPYTQNP